MKTSSALLGLSVLAALSGCALIDNPNVGCSSNTDCKNGGTCINSLCYPPGTAPSSSASSTSATAATTSASASTSSSAAASISSSGATLSSSGASSSGAA